MSEPAPCRHDAFDVAVEVKRLPGEPAGVGQQLAALRVCCALCRLPFVFVGPAEGVTLNGVSASRRGDVLFCPVEPVGGADAGEIARWRR